MINLKDLRGALKDIWNERGELLPDDRITIRKKKKMALVKTANGDVKTKRINYIRIEIIE